MPSPCLLCTERTPPLPPRARSRRRGHTSHSLQRLKQHPRTKLLAVVLLDAKHCLDLFAVNVVEDEEVNLLPLPIDHLEEVAVVIAACDLALAPANIGACVVL